MLGFPLLYFKGMRLMMFQLSSFYCRAFGYRRVLLTCSVLDFRLLSLSECRMALKTHPGNPNYKP